MSIVSIASMKWLAMLEPTDLGMALYIVFSFVLFISGLFLGVSLSPNRRKQREPWHARLNEDPDATERREARTH